MHREVHQSNANVFSRCLAFATSRMWVGYTVAVFGTLVAVVVRLLLQRAVKGELQAFTTFYPVVFIAAVLGGAGPGLLATVLSALAADYFFLEPGFGFATVAQEISFALFLVVNIGVSFLGGRFHKKAEALRTNAARLNLSHQVARVGSFEVNLQTDVSTWSPEMEAMYGLKPRQFGGNRSAWQALVHPEDRPRALVAVDRALQTFQPEEGEWRVVWPDGSVHWVVGRFQAFRDRMGKPSRLVGVNVDITDRKATEEALRESEDLCRALATGGSYAEYRMAPDWSEMRQLRGHRFIADTDAPTREWLEKYVPTEDQALVLAAVDEAVRTKSSFQLEHRIRRADGSIGWTASRAIPLLDGQGNVTEWFGAAHDVTKRKEAEQALRDSEARFRTMADAIPQLAWIAQDASIIWINRRTVEYTGATLEELKGGGWQVVVAAETLPLVQDRIKHSVITGEPFEIECPLRGADGRFRSFLTRSMPLKDEGGRVSLWFGTSTDISELRERELALRRQARLIDLAPAATLVARADLTITFWSKGAEKLYGWTAAEALGRRNFELLRTEEPEQIKGIVEKLRHGSTWAGELKHRNRRGEQIVVESYWLGEVNARGELEGILESNTDITERKRLQQHLQEEVDLRTAKLRETIAELEHMSYSMVHDMRAPLRAMQSFAYILQEDCPDCQHPPGSEYLAIIRQSSMRLDRLITDALYYSRLVREEVPLCAVKIRPLLRGIVNTYPNLQPRLADVVVDVEDLAVLGNESLLTQCFGNLLDNAVKFVAPGVRPKVRVWAEEIEQHAEHALPVVRIWFEDNGVGIRKDAQERIFRMFQRMHPEKEYPGTGIGLTIVKKALERMNGRIGLESEPGKGSRFWVELPEAVQSSFGKPAGIAHAAS